MKLKKAYRVTRDEYTALRAHAAETGRTVAGFVAWAALREVGRYRAYEAARKLADEKRVRVAAG